jgi:hypothetical protein
MIGARTSPGCEICKRERKTDSDATNVPVETVAHIQSAGCKAQKQSLIGAHNRCWKYLVGAITAHGEAKRDLEFIGGDKDRQLKQLWTETRIGSISYHGMTLRMKQKGFLRATGLRGKK